MTRRIYFMLKPYFYISRLYTSKLFIRNKDLPVCVNCLHFIEDKTNYPYDPPPNDAQYGKCKKFGEVNFITGLIDYDFASRCRNDDKKCGSIASEYIYKG